MPDQRQRRRSVRQRTAHDKVIIAVHEDTHDVSHAISSSHDARIGNRVTDRKVVHNLTLLG